MRLQRTRSSCGSAAICNALECLGIRRTEDEIAVLCKQSPDGTKVKDLLAALATIEGVTPVMVEEAKPDVAILRLLQALYDGHPVIVVVDSWEHYAVAVGVLGFGKKIGCIDSADNDLYKTRTIERFVEWWKGPEGVKKPYWAVIV